MSTWGQISFHNAASPIMQLLIDFHDFAMILATAVTVFVAVALFALTENSFTCRKVLEAQLVETVWTILPAVMLFMLAIPSLRLLYTIDELPKPQVSLKAIGHQWYWSYEYTDFKNTVQFDSYMIPTEDLLPGQFRLLEVDNRVVLPYKMDIRILVTAADVIHSWAIPSLGIKLDGIPGRLNQVGITINHAGVYYGQCSEICGANHTFMPIAIEVVDYKTFLDWIEGNMETQALKPKEEYNMN